MPSVRVCLAAGDDDLDARAEDLRHYLAEPGVAGEVDGPCETDWFTRDLAAVDADGYGVVLTSPRMADIAAAGDWSRSVRESVGRRPGESAH